jgi:uncharacterized protein
MKIELNSIFESIGKCIDINLNEKLSFPEDDFITSTPLNVIGNATNTGKTVLLTLSVKTTLTLECGRCLKKFTHPLTFKIEEQYYRSISEYKELTGEIELTENDFFYLIENNTSIDLYEILRQNILTNIPIVSVCDSTCEGINTNDNSENTTDPRFAILQNLIKED